MPSRTSFLLASLGGDDTTLDRVCRNLPIVYLPRIMSGETMGFRITFRDQDSRPSVLKHATTMLGPRRRRSVPRVPSRRASAGAFRTAPIAKTARLHDRSLAASLQNRHLVGPTNPSLHRSRSGRHDCSPPSPKPPRSRCRRLCDGGSRRNRAQRSRAPRDPVCLLPRRQLPCRAQRRRRPTTSGRGDRLLRRGALAATRTIRS